MSVLITASYLYWRGWDINWQIALWALIGIILFHAAGNLISDYYDFKKGIDADDTFGSKTLTSGSLTPKQVIIFGWVMLALAVVNGLGIAACTGWGLLIFGVLGALFTLLYPWMKAHAMGDLCILLEYGIIPALGTAYAVAGYQGGFALAVVALYMDALWIVLAFATITIAVLHCNNTRDVHTDKRAGIKTFAMQLGKEMSIVMYAIEVTIPTLWVVTGVLCGRMPWESLLIALTLIPAFANSCTMVRYEADDQAINFLDEATAKHQLMNGLLLTLTLVGAHFLEPLIG